MTQRFSARLWKAVVPVVALAAGFVAGSLDRPGPRAVADVRSSPPREAFQSGSERSETVLREIAATLSRIDGRVERIEKALAKRTTDRHREP